MPSPSAGLASSETSASPVVIPTRSSSPSSTAKSRIASAARTARSGSSSCATGAPKSAITASPMNFSTVPPWRSSSVRTRAWYGRRSASTSSGSIVSARCVKPTRSQKTTVTTLRSRRGVLAMRQRVRPAPPVVVLPVLTFSDRGRDSVPPMLTRRLLVLAVLCGALALGGVALAAASFSDRAGDNNAAPDVTSVTVSESAEGIATIVVAVSNYPALPLNSWFNLWFDLDNNPNTGDDGDEALVQYFDDGGIQFRRWVGNELVRRPATGMTGTYTAGTLTLTVPKAALDSVASFGVLAVGNRGQDDGEGDERVAADFAPNVGNTRYMAPGPLSITDAIGDNDAAPDITKVDVSDTRAGTIRFAITTPSHQTLRPSTGSRSTSTSTGGAARAMEASTPTSGSRGGRRTPDGGARPRTTSWTFPGLA